MSLKSFEVAFTRIPNIIIDKYLPELQGSEMSVLTVIFRKTIGFNKEKDRIALSTFEKMSGQARSTVIKAIKELIGKQLVLKDTSTTPTTYSINSKLLKPDNSDKNKVVRNSNRSMIIEPEMGGFSNQQLVRNSNTQKNTIKKKKETTISRSILSDNVLKVVEEWNKRFNVKVKLIDSKVIKDVEDALKEFSVDQLKIAMRNRLESDYYKNNRPELLNNPRCFFPYLDTIQNDFNREKIKLYTYDQKVAMITEKGMNDDSFIIRIDKTDNRGRAMWELEN